MPEQKSSVLKTLLDNSKKRTEAANAKAAAEAEAKAKRLAASQEAEAEAATNSVIVALEDAAAGAEAAGGNPAITGLMTGLAGYITGGAVSGPAQAELDEAVADKEAALANAQLWNDRAQQLETQVRTAIAEKDDLQVQLNQSDTARTDLRDELDEANRTNSNLQSQVTGLTRELDQAETEFAELKQHVENLPKIDLTRRTVGGEVKIKLHDAQNINEGRQFLRNLLGLDPVPTPAPAPVPAPASPVPGL